MKISVLGFDHGKYDRRVVMKDVAYLVSRGFDVQYLYREDETKDFQKSVPMLDEKVKFVAVPKVGRGLLSRKKFEDEIVKISTAFKPDYFYLHGMFLTYPVKRLKSLKKIGKIVYDEHEYSPEPVAIENLFLKKVVENIIKIRDKRVSKYIDSAFTVSKSIRDYMMKIGYKNVELKPNVSEKMPILPIPLKKRKKVLVVAGGLQKERGPFKVLDIFNALNKKIKDLELHLHVKFSGENLESDFKEYIKQNKIKNIKILELVPYEELIEKISQSLGTFMAFPIGHWKTNYIALPNRFFDSLVASTPLIASSDSIDVANEVKENDLGIVIDFKNFENSIDDLVDFITNEKRYDSSLERIYEYAKKNSWQEISKVLDKVFV